MQTSRRPYLISALARREQSHRRAALLGVAILLVLSTSPVFGHHITGSASRLLAGHDHLWSMCLVAIHLLLAPVHGLFHILIIAGIGYAVWDRLRAWQRLRATLGALQSATPELYGPLFVAARTVGLDPSAVRVVHGLPSPAFTAGWWRPVVYVAGDLPDRLTVAELAAVLGHEAAHVVRHDPLRLSLLRFLGCLLFWMPALRRLAADLADEAEIQADDEAAKERPLVLASAILALASGGASLRAPSSTSGFQSPDLIERRIHRLTGGEGAVGTHVTRRSLVSAVAALTLVWVSGLVVAHPLPAATPTHAFADHCEHHHASAFSHLFCLRAAHRASGAPCPHAHA
ncbi:MAG: M56 family metallopeptidase [Gemmatimonadaceae bacterium]